MAVKNLSELFEYVKTLGEVSERAATLAVIETGQYAHVEAINNARKQFTGRNGRTLSGALQNSIYAEYEIPPGEKIPELHLGTKGIPYGRIHELGGEIKPVKAEKLWIPNYKYAGRMTPKEFMNLRKQNPKQYTLTPDIAGIVVNPEDSNSDIKPLFMRVDHVTMPARPYLTPAMQKASLAFMRFFVKHLANEVKRES